MKKIKLLLFFLYIFQGINSQIQLSNQAEVSIITAGPGAELYEAFGHSAIRIKDPIFNIDIIYNYGLFDFNAPNFYTNFTKGRLEYSLGKQDANRFFYYYKLQKRWVKQQILNLNLSEKQLFYNYLENNALPKNANYLYDPYFNNCATKLRDITHHILGDKLIFSIHIPHKNLSFRQLMDNEIPWNTWGSFGINLALGSKLDRIANPEQYMYLPDYVYAIFKTSNRFKKNQPVSLIKREDDIINFNEIEQNTSLFNPLTVFSLISLVILLITALDYSKNRRTKWLDFFILFGTGLLGVVIVFLWMFTNHSTTPNNFNILWAFAPNLAMAFILLKKTQKKWVVTYFKFLVLFLLIIPIIWISKIQQLPISIIPILVSLLMRYLFLSKKALLPPIK